MTIQYFTLWIIKNVQSFSKEPYSCVDIADVVILTDSFDIQESRRKPIQHLKQYVIRRYLNIKNIPEATIKMLFWGRLANVVTDIFLSKSVIETEKKKKKKKKKRRKRLLVNQHS